MDDEIAMPCGAALVAGTMALMTAYAQPDARQAEEASPRRSPGQDCAPARRLLLARKVVSNLLFLREHPDVDAGLRKVAARMHAHWDALLRHLDAPTADPAPDAHRTTLDAADRPATALLH